MRERVPKIISYPEIATEIEDMYKADQKMRKKNLENSDHWDEELDKTNTERMEQIVNQIGWPSVSKVGIDFSHYAWLLVQHADHNVNFQEKCLNLMKECPQGEVEMRHIAYLEDRVRVNKGQPQLYGTQFTVIDGKHVPKPIYNAEDTNERRKSVGLGTIEEYTAHMHEKYGEPTKDEGT